MRTPVRKWENRVVSKRSTFESDEKSATGKDESLEDSANLPDPDVIAQEIDSQISLCSPFGLPVHVVRSRDLRCRRPSSRPQPILAWRGYSTVTSVPIGTSAKNFRAASSGSRMQPCDAG